MGAEEREGTPPGLVEGGHFCQELLHRSAASLHATRTRFETKKQQ